MKKLIFAFFLLLASCSPTKQPAPTPEMQETYPPSLDAFKSSELCPDICWLGIHPGITTYEQVVQIITTSNQFEQRFTEISDSNIKAFWFPDNTQKFHTGVTLVFSNNLVESITLGRLAPFTVQDFVILIGQPSEMSFMVQQGLHDDKYSVYNLYYPSLKTTFQVRSGGEHGPEPNDFILQLIINKEYQDNYRQPWLGYGHFEEYLLRSIPTSTVPSPQ